MNKKFLIVFLALVFVSGAVNLCAQSTSTVPVERVEKSKEPNLITAVQDVAEKIGPAVVAIQTEWVERYTGGYGTPFGADLFSQFFGDLPLSRPEFERRSAGLGSGVIIDKQGYILTNEHVVRFADKITVTLPDGRTFDGLLKGTDPRSDLALVKIYAPDLPVAPMGDSDQLKIGEWAVAIGNPFGNVLADPHPTVTTGVVSALHRSLPTTSRMDSDYSDLIQTDAAINPGNSGGPLVNLKGEVVGINVAIFSTSGGYQGIGFAIPINYAKAIVDELVEGKKVTHGWVGVGVQDLDYRLARYFGLKSMDGVVVVKVVDGSPAEKAGLKEGDVVLSVNAIRIRNSNTFVRYISSAPMGRRLALEVWREGQKEKEKILLEVAQRPDVDLLSKVDGQKPAQPVLQGYWRGIKVGEFTPTIAQQLKTEYLPGVLVADVRKGSRAQEAGLQKNDVIIEVNKQQVGSSKAFSQLVQQVQGSCLIRTLRGYFVLEE
ncbi:MAG: Do family serine endopeptidase [Candidatus Omnitrophica bacterium]|nr:Do family serine endopeptidase [Candidatus Omnitrophota bacterium]